MSDETTRDANVRLSADVDPYRRSVQQATQDTSKLSVAVDSLSQKLEGLSKRAGKKLLLFGGAGAAGIATVTTEAAQFEKRLSVLNATAAITDKNMGQVRKQVTQLSKDFPISRDAAVELLTSLDKLGVEGGKKIREVADSMVKLSASTGEDIGGLTTGLVELGKQMGTLNAGDMSNFANSLLQVSKNAGVSAQGVLQFSQAIAPTARVAGLTETQVLGVSAAFQKAGADGFAAANTFNTMLADITRQVVTGSPEIAKYANLIGVTTTQFKNMDRADALTSIFEAINKQGPDAIKTLDRLGFDGVRTMRSIQAVAQSGGLRKAIDDAVGAGTNNQALDTSSAAAMGGLADQMTKVRSEFQSLATTAGTPFVQAFTPVVKIFNDLLGVVNALAAPLAQVGAALSGVMAGGALLLGGGMVMSRMNAILGGISAVGRSSMVQGARAGSEVGRGLARGEQVENRYSRASAAGDLRWWQQPFYSAGVGYGQMAGDRQSIVGRAGLTGLRGAMGLATSLTDAQAEYYRNARRPGLDRDAPLLGGAGNLARAALSPRSFLTGFREGGGIASAAGAAKTPEEFGAALRSSTATAMENIKATQGEVTAKRQLAASTGALTKAFLKLEFQSAATGAATMGRGALGAARGLGSGLLGLAGGPAGLGLLAATTIGAMTFANTNKAFDKPETDNATSLDKYNVSLGIATTELGTFASAVKSAYANLPKADTVRDVQRVSEQVIALARTPGRELTNDQVGRYRTTRQQAAYLGSLNITDPRQLQGAQADLVQQFGVQQAQRAVNRYFNQGRGQDYGGLVQSITGEQGGGLLSRRRLEFATTGGNMGTGAARTAAAETFEDIQGQQTRNATRVNQRYADQVAQNQFLRLMSSATSASATSNRRGTATARDIFAEYAGRFMGDREKLSGLDPTQFSGIQNPQRRAAAIARALQAAAPRRMDDYTFSQTGIVGGQALAGLAAAPSTGTTSRLTQLGAIGRVAVGNQTIGAALSRQGDVNAQYQGIQELFTRAKDLGGSFSGTDSELQKLKATIQDTQDPLYIMAQNAQQFNAQMRQNAQTYMGRAGRLEDTTASYRGVMGEDPNAPDHMQRVQQSQQELEESKKGYYAYLQSLVQAQKNYSIQMERGEEDRQRTISRSNRDFNRQMARASEDAAKSMYDPWKRVYSTYTVDAGAMLQNLADQNERMQKQVDQVNKLRQQGLSRKAVDTLNLTDPSQQQQLDRLTTDIANDPALISRINRQIATRSKATTGMVENVNNQTFRRAKQDHERSLADMADDWGIQVERTKEDLARMGDEVVGGFGSVMTRAVRMLRKNLGPLADNIITELDRVREANPEFFQDLSAPQSTAKTPQSQVGKYSPPSARAADHAAGGGRQTPENVHQADRASRTIDNFASNRTIPSRVARGGGGTTIDHSTNFNGQITVQASDPQLMAKQLAARARVTKLTRPTLQGNT